MRNNGLENEAAFVEAVNGKTFKELPPGLQDLLKDAGLGDFDKPFTANLCNRFSKPDITIWAGKTPVHISIKSGTSDSMHFENVKSLVLFFRKSGISVATQKTFLRFYYGDGTMDGTGKRKLTYGETLKWLWKDIEAANKEINDPKYREMLFDRFVFKGREGRVIRADYLIYGTPASFIFVSRKDVLSSFPYLFRKRKFGLRFGPMTFQPYLRKSYWKKNGREKDKYQVKWHKMVFDYEYIRFGAKSAVSEAMSTANADEGAIPS